MAVAVHKEVHHSPARDEKVRRSKALSEQMLSSPVVALVAFRGVPAANLQLMRRDLKAKGHHFRVDTNSQITHALELAAGKNPKLGDLIPLVNDQTAVLTSKSNPFVLSHQLKKTRNKVAARGGEVAPEDILVPAGETSFKPGPIVAELQHAGFPAAIEKGKVVIKKDTVIVKKGDSIGREVAQMLSRLDVKPIEVGLMMRAAVEEGLFYPAESLTVDLDGMLLNMVLAQSQAIALALKAGFITDKTLPLLLVKAKRQAIRLAKAGGFISPETIVSLLERAVREGNAFKSLAK